MPGDLPSIDPFNLPDPLGPFLGDGEARCDDAADDEEDREGVFLAPDGERRALAGEAPLRAAEVGVTFLATVPLAAVATAKAPCPLAMNVNFFFSVSFSFSLCHQAFSCVLFRVVHR